MEGMTRADWRIGMVGLGALGLPMAVNLHRAGFRLQVHTRSRGAENDPLLLGSCRCDNPAAAADNVDVLVLCVSDDSAVTNVLFGPDGAAEHLQPGSIVIDCSTVSPKGAEQAAAICNRSAFTTSMPPSRAALKDGPAPSRCWLVATPLFWRRCAHCWR